MKPASTLDMLKTANVRLRQELDAANDEIRLLDRDTAIAEIFWRARTRDLDAANANPRNPAVPMPRIRFPPTTSLTPLLAKFAEVELGEARERLPANRRILEHSCWHRPIADADHTHALVAEQCHSIPDNLVAVVGPDPSMALLD